ncbi:hypothetical protein MPRF_45850 [Mycolicibacterium parafortuitum]|uniref:Uncharacterized protein n=1 Tax=Mycolicibacterium parafortuitum TaxID=39692 RepID=A0A7I7UBM7_MYCPF|nr:hypothetical protein [Mycolicibacterium parafortuitum]BBY77686.1 hypothetical protein MPRF_45850 [Mycolicibacterium parafortuitum]
MYLTAQQLAVANQAIKETFETSCISWQVLPQWDTGDPAKTAVPADDVTTAIPSTVAVVGDSEPLTVTLATVTSGSPDFLLARIIDKAVDLAAKVDKAVIPKLRTTAANSVAWDNSTVDKLLLSLIDARTAVETAGYRAPSCLVTNTDGLKEVSVLVSGYSVQQTLLDTANIGSLQRAEQVAPTTTPNARAVLVGRRQRIPHGGASDESPGEEPVDLAVSVPPSLEVLGEDGANTIKLAVRVRYALRIKDKYGLVKLDK